jgi:hypothetical protein
MRSRERGSWGLIRIERPFAHALSKAAPDIFFKDGRHEEMSLVGRRWFEAAQRRGRYLDYRLVRRTKFSFDKKKGRAQLFIAVFAALRTVFCPYG